MIIEHISIHVSESSRNACTGDSLNLHCLWYCDNKNHRECSWKFVHILMEKNKLKIQYSHCVYTFSYFKKYAVKKEN